MNNLDKTYQDLLKDILENGTRKGDRTGTGTISVFGRQIRHKMAEGFPLLTTKKMYTKGIIAELLWFLRGETNIKSLLDNDCHIWDGDAYKKYIKDSEEFSTSEQVEYGECTYSASGMSFRPFSIEGFINKIKTDDEFAAEWGELGPIYGKQWRSWKHMGPKSQQEMLDENTNWPWKTTEIDQIANLIHDLKTNPDSRRLMVSAWNVCELGSMTLPPCHYGFQVYTRELSWDERHELAETKYQLDDTDEELDKHNIPTRAISLMWNQRSCDFPLGIPFNIASYGLLLEIIGKMVNMVPEELIGNLGDCHIYLNQIEGCEEQIGRYLEVDERVCMCYENPKLDLSRIQEGMSDSEFTKVCDEFGIPTRTREPFELPKLVFGKTDEFFKSLSDDLSLITHLDNTDFNVENYQSHPTIKFPLSN